MSDLQRLQAAAGDYRLAVEARGITWPSPDHGQVDPPPRLAEYHGITEVPEELLWLHSFLAPEYHGASGLPNGGWLLPWPASAQEALQQLEYYGAMPFPWRRQIPVFDFEYVVFTLAVDDAHMGEIWRFEIGSEGHYAVRAAPNLSSVFESWGQIAARDGFFRSPYDDLLRLRSRGDGDWEYLRDTLGVDPLTYPVALLDYAETERRQRACGVDPQRAEDLTTWRATADEIAEVVKRLDA